MPLFPNYSWVERLPAHPQSWPGSSCYDDARSNVVKFGGVSGTPGFFVYHDDTWTWDGTDWTELFPIAKPDPRSDHSVAYDYIAAKSLCFGGADDSVFFNDLWSWNGSTWTDITPVGTKPSTRQGCGFAHDPITGDMILFGGFRNTSPVGHCAETWKWDGAAWTQLTPVHSPSQRSNMGMITDITNGEIVLFGGYAGIPFYNDTWTWDGSDWIEKSPATVPPVGRARQGFAYLSALGVVMQGGLGFPSTDFYKTWTWDGTDWTLQAPLIEASVSGPWNGMSGDEARAEVVRMSGETWVYTPDEQADFFTILHTFGLND